MDIALVIIFSGYGRVKDVKCLSINPDIPSFKKLVIVTSYFHIDVLSASLAYNGIYL